MSREQDDEIIKQARQILRRRVRRGSILASPQEVRKWLQVQFCEYTHEVFHVTFLDNQHRVIAHEVMFTGTIDGSAVYPRRVAEQCLKHHASAVIFSHNHPSGVAEPSTADRRITERLCSALSLLDIRVLDHFIVTGDNFHSFAEHGQL